MKATPTAPNSCQNCPRRQQSMFGCCQLAELNLVAGSKTFQTYQKGQVIFQEGSRLNNVYCIYKGTVKKTKTGGDGKTQIVRFAGEGDTLGHRSLMNHGPYSCSAVAIEDCVVCMVPRNDVLSLLEQNSQFTRGLLTQLAYALDDAELRMLHLAYKPVRERLAEALMLLHRTFCRNGESVSIPVSREDLASLMGTAVETASRLVSEFKKEGLIATKGTRINILNASKLMEISSFYE